MIRPHRHRGKRLHRHRAGAYLALWGGYWRYFRNSGYRALPNLKFRQVYSCDWGDHKADGPQPRHYHIGRRKASAGTGRDA